MQVSLIQGLLASCKVAAEPTGHADPAADSMEEDAEPAEPRELALADVQVATVDAFQVGQAERPHAA